MSRTWHALVIVLGIQTGIAGAAAYHDLFPACGGCRVNTLPWGLAGAVFYLPLFVLAMLRGPSRTVTGGLLAALGIHATLAASLAFSGRFCGLCFSAAAGSLLLAALAVRFDRRNLPRLIALAPWGALLVLLVQGLPRLDPGPAADEPVRLVVYTQPDCRYCDDFRNGMAPSLEREFGPRLKLVYKAAADLPSIRRTPTFLIAPRAGRSSSRVIEGLPSIDALRTAIHEVELRS